MSKTTEELYFPNEKRYEDLTIMDNFMFAKVMLNERLCKKFLELVLHVKICRIQYYNDEQSLKKFYHSKGIRLDVYLNDEKGTIYNIDMQTTNKYNLPKRSRYYQGMIDLNLLEPGDDYNKLAKQREISGRLRAGIRYSFKQALIWCKHTNGYGRYNDGL